MNEMTNKRQGSILNTIYKEQFRLKLGIVYLFASGFNILALIVCYFINKNSTLDKAVTIYLLVMVLYYKFWFKQTKDGGYYRVFMFRVFSDFKRKTFKILREILQENSAKKIKGDKYETFKNGDN